jgi:hypothetical protein
MIEFLDMGLASLATAGIDWAISGPTDEIRPRVDLRILSRV